MLRPKLSDNRGFCSVSSTVKNHVDVKKATTISKMVWQNTLSKKEVNNIM